MSPMNPRLLRPTQNIHPEAADWANRVRTNGGSVSGSTLVAVSRFCRSIDAAGIRSKFLRLNLFCGTGLNACLVPLYRSFAALGTPVGNSVEQNLGSPSFVDANYNETGASAGLQGGGNRHLNTGVATNLLTAGDRHISAYEIARSGATFDVFLGSENDTNVSKIFDLGYQSSASAVAFGFSEFSTAAGSLTTSTGGHWLGVNIPAGTGLIYKNGIEEGTNTGSPATPPASNIFVMAKNRASASAATDIYGGRLGGYSLGAALNASEALAYYNAMQAFQTAIGRNV